MSTSATATTARPSLRVHVRPMIGGDLDEVHAIARASFDRPWTGAERLAVPRQANVIGVVALYGTCVLGFAIFDLGCGSITVRDFAVLPAARRRGVGGQLMGYIRGRLAEDHRPRLIVDVRETNLGGQLFLRSQGFRATQLIRGHFESNGEDAYRFVYSIKDACSGR